MDVFGIFLWYLVSHYWWFLTSSPLIIESVLNQLFDYENWIDQYVSRQRRKQITYGLSLVGIIVASFLAFRDIYLELQDAQRALAKAQEQLAARGPEEQAKAITKLQEANSQLDTELRSTQQRLSALQSSMQTRHLSLEERKKFTEVLAAHDGQPFGEISMRAFPSCHECMVYVYDLVDAIRSVPTWAASGGGNHYIKVDFSGIGIGIKDTRVPPPIAGILADALKAAGLSFTIEPLDFVAPDRCMLIVGNKP
jgi:hypothetical protein